MVLEQVVEWTVSYSLSFLCAGRSLSSSANRPDSMVVRARPMIRCNAISSPVQRGSGSMLAAASADRPSNARARARRASNDVGP